MLVALGTVGGIQFFSDFSFAAEQFGTIAGSLAIVLMIIIFVLYLLGTMVLQSMLVGGLYGSTIESVFENRSSIGTYFTYSFRHPWRLTGLQLAILLLWLPVLLGMVLGNLLIDHLFAEEFLVFTIVC